MQFFDQDRPFLVRACELAGAARRPPRRLGQKVEPTWAALLAEGSKEIASASFSAGDAEDAVKRLHGIPAGTSLEDCTLYLTLEPKAGFDRLPPVTESIRLLGVKRVVVGSLDPAQRYRGEGVATLERMGIRVILADGEEARLAQQLLEDYSRWLSRGISVLRARVELRAIPEGNFDLSLDHEEKPAQRADAILCVAGKPVQSGNSWLVVLDADGREKPAEKKIIYQSEASTTAPGVRRLAFRDGEPDLGALLRDLGSLGILSVELNGDAHLFRQALRSGLVESVLAQFPDAGDSLHALSRVDRVRLQDGAESVELKLEGARLLNEQSLEAHVELC